MRLAPEAARAVQTCQFGTSSEVYQITVGEDATYDTVRLILLWKEFKKV